ncbi:uncharacterized protein [Fopius arisanus]|uniref:IBB domain-containing protein n=1 Tax=Fopius arisanus TaxID=64838 RepID=A0A9R1TZ81_9HYME|nr:PREDICTED: uncharacterized protein LOC105266637 [Fopius arisanus]
MDSPVECSSTPHGNENAVEIIRHGLRRTAENERRDHRNREFNKLRRTALGVNENVSSQCEWTGKSLLQKGKDLKKKTLSINDYKQLEGALLQDENIKEFLSIDQILSAVVRDLSSSNPEIQLLALHCCCNIALGDVIHSILLCKYIGPYLITQLESRNNPLLEASAWTIGNLCNSGSKEIIKALNDLGCLNRLSSLLQSCQKQIIPSVSYALKFYLFGNSSSEIMRESDFILVTQIAVDRLLEDHMSSDLLWLLALLSSTAVCRNHLSRIIPSILSNLMHLQGNEREAECRIGEIIASVRILANLIAEDSGNSAGFILTQKSNSSRCKIEELFNKLLTHPHFSVRRETLWMIGNIYNHPALSVRKTLENHMKFLDFSRAVDCR